jgi:hypothetical protein
MTARAITLVAVVVAVLVALPEIAAACPYCAGQDDGGPARGFVIGAMIVTPFIAALVCGPLVIRMIRRSRELEREHERFRESSVDE